MLKRLVILKDFQGPRPHSRPGKYDFKIWGLSRMCNNPFKLPYMAMHIDWCGCGQSQRVDSWSGPFLSVRRALLRQHDWPTPAASALAASLDRRRTWLALCRRLWQWPCLTTRRETATETSDVVGVGRSQTAMATLLHCRNGHPCCRFCYRKCCTLSRRRWENVKEKEIICSNLYWHVTAYFECLKYIMPVIYRVHQKALTSVFMIKCR